MKKSSLIMIMDTMMEINDDLFSIVFFSDFTVGCAVLTYYRSNMTQTQASPAVLIIRIIL